MENIDSKKPEDHTKRIKAKLAELTDHLRKDIEIVPDARFQALAETSAEVLIGLQKAFSDFEKKNEPAWQE